MHRLNRTAGDRGPLRVLVVRLGTLCPFIVGGLLSVAGWLLFLFGAFIYVLEVAGRSNCTPSTPFFCNLGHEAFLTGIVLVAVAGAPLGAAVGMWERRTWGRWLGAAGSVAGLGFLVWVWEGNPGFWELIVPAIGYCLTLVGAVVWYPAASEPGGPESPVDPSSP